MRAEILPSYLQFLVLLLFRNSSGNAELEAVQDIEGAGSGYILYCPCMGRFGNQADHFLGVLAFAKGTARTLVIPPWIEYQIGRGGSEMVSFDSYFNASTVSEYHDAITMEYFFNKTKKTCRWVRFFGRFLGVGFFEVNSAFWENFSINDLA